VPHGAYGKNLADCFRLQAAPTFVSRALRHSTIAVTRIDCETDNNGLTEPLSREDALLVTLQLRDCAEHDLWIDGKPMPTAHLRAGTTCVYDLRSDPIANSVSPFSQVHFYFPRSALAAVAEGDIGTIESQWHNPGIGMDDAVIRNLGVSLLPAFEHPEEATSLFVDHVATAAAVYIVQLFGGAHRRSVVTGALSPWQERRARELLREHLDGSISIAQLAYECGQSPRTFSDAFRKATGMSPHRWLSAQRMEKARALLHAHHSLSSVATHCGFVSEAHLKRALIKQESSAPLE